MHISIYLRNILKSMSTREIQFHIQKSKRNDMKNQIKTSPSQVSLQVLGSGVRGTPSTLYVSTDHFKYLFNCGEGTQRLGHEHHLRLAKLENIFFTSPTWKNMGGLPGMALTLQDMGVPELKLHGPTGIREIFEAVKRFVLLTTLEVKEFDCRENNCYVDTCMAVRYVHLIKNTPDSDSDSVGPVIVDDTDYYAHELNKNGKRSVKRQKQEKYIRNKKMAENPIIEKVRGSVVYICKLHPKSGSLNLEKCVELGITPGPLLGKLKDGNDVQLDDGKIVKSTDVCDPPIPGPVFIVVECPNEDYLDSLVNNETFRDYQKDAADPENVAKHVVHFTPEEIMQNPRYMEWMSRFGEETEHLVLNDNNNCYSYGAIHKLQHKLNLLHPTIFPLLPDYCSEVENTNDENKPNGSQNKLIIRRAKTLNSISLRPPDVFNDTEVILNKKADIEEIPDTEGFFDILENLKTEINSRSLYLEKSPSYPKILMLGTGSCIPNKTRNTSGILMRIDDDTSVLMDCGEGSYGQLFRFFGPSEIDKILISIKAIFVSHLHADHHLGLLGILQHRKCITDEPIFLIAPKQIESWLILYHMKFEKINSTYILIPSECLIVNSPKIDTNSFNEMKEKLKLDDVYTIDVFHCLHSYAVAWELKCKKKIVYSGDTRPTQNMVKIGKFCDLLIHEATMEDELNKEAIVKMHSTMSEALSIGRQMEARFILLTHFSQRYSKMPRLPEKEEVLDNVGIAFDNMQFSMAELSLLPLFYPALRLMFSEFCNSLVQKAEKRRKDNKLIKK